MKRIIYIACSIILLILILFNPIYSFEGAKSGLNLWFYTIIPTLLPFIIVSNIMISLNATDALSSIIAPLTSRTLKISKASNYAIIIGLLCGYPMGAKAVNDLVVHSKISRMEGQYLLGFCNNVSPMFIISFILHTSLKAPELTTKVLFILYGAPFITAILLNSIFRKKSRIMEYQNLKVATNVTIDFQLIDACIIKSFETIIKLGGYLIIFSIISYFLVHTLTIHDAIKSILICTIEITTGINYTSSSYISQKAMVLIICTLTSFGGLSILAQTQSIIKESGLSITKYILCKSLNTLLAFLIGYFIL